MTTSASVARSCSMSPVPASCMAPDSLAQAQGAGQVGSGAPRALTPGRQHGQRPQAERLQHSRGRPCRCASAELRSGCSSHGRLLPEVGRAPWCAHAGRTCTRWLWMEASWARMHCRRTLSSWSQYSTTTCSSSPRHLRQPVPSGRHVWALCRLAVRHWQGCPLRGPEPGRPERHARLLQCWGPGCESAYCQREPTLKDGLGKRHSCGEPARADAAVRESPCCRRASRAAQRTDSLVVQQHHAIVQQLQQLHLHVPDEMSPRLLPPPIVHAAAGAASGMKAGITHQQPKLRTRAVTGSLLRGSCRHGCHAGLPLWTLPQAVLRAAAAQRVECLSLCVDGLPGEPCAESHR